MGALDVDVITRARNADGTYRADDPNTPEDEAWVLVDGTTGGEV